MFKYGSRCFDTIRDASLYYRIPEKDVIKYLMNNNDMEQLIEDLGLDDLIEVNTLYQQDISSAISEIQDIYREYMMLENSEEISFLDAMEEDLRIAADSFFVEELNFEEGNGHWGFYSPDDELEETIEEDGSGWVVTPEPVYLFSDPYPFQLEVDLQMGDTYPIPAPENDKVITKPVAGAWLKFNK